MIRLLLLLLALAVLPQGARADFRIATDGCVKPGQVLTITGRSFTPRPSGEIVLRGGNRSAKMAVRSWSAQRVRAAVPRSGLSAGQRYDVLWVIQGGRGTALGKVTLCAKSGGTNRERAGRDVVPAPDGSPEYVVSVPAGQAQAAANALQGQGATLLRTRQLPQLGRSLLIFAFPGGLTLAEARAALAQSAPAAQIDRHHIYGYAAGPRVYAAAMIGDDPGGACRLRRPVRVGLVDGPVNPAHPALAGVGVTRHSALSRGEKAGGADHGTAVAALIGSGSGAGALTGFASGARIYAAQAVSVSRGREGARLENVAAGLDWLAGQRVQVVNLSIAGGVNAAFADILAAASGRGMVLIAAAGNERSSAPRFPAASSHTIAVTAVDAAGKLYRNANTGKHIEFAAPGVDLYVAKGGGGGYRSGTSYAAPIVTALVARMAARGGVNATSARRALAARARDLGAAGRDAKYGYGLVQAGGC